MTELIISCARRARAPSTRSFCRTELLEFAASISESPPDELLRLQAAEAKARRDRELLEWLAPMSDEHQRELRALEQKEAQERESRRRLQRFASADPWLTEWNEADHPRAPKGTSIGGQWIEKGGGGATGAASTGSPSTFDTDSEDDEAFKELTVTPAMVRSSGWLGSIREKLRVAGEIGGAFVAGLGTGAKAVVNGLATAARSTVTLGLNTDQLELIGVSKQDRERGYDTAAMISTGSGQVLIAVGTGGMASALAKGGTVARAAGGALVAYDAAGNAVGVVQGIVDAEEEGVTLANGVQIGAGALGIGANIKAAKSLVKTSAAAPPRDALVQRTPSHAPAKTPATEFRVGRHGDMPSPRPGKHSHHGVMSAWMERVFSGYDAKKAPAILMPENNHRATFGIYRKWRAQVAKKLDGKFDWTQVSEGDVRELSERMFDAAKVPDSVRKEYWAEFERMKTALHGQQPPHSLEALLWGEHIMSDEVKVLTAEEMQHRYGSFYTSSPMVRLDRSKVPEQFWPLLPYAEFWGIADDWTREDLVKKAPPEVLQDLKQVVAAFDSALDQWLAGPEADDPSPTDEYVAFCAMGMAADYA